MRAEYCKAHGWLHEGGCLVCRAEAAEVALTENGIDYASLLNDFHKLEAKLFALEVEYGAMLDDMHRVQAVVAAAREWTKREHSHPGMNFGCQCLICRALSALGEDK